jgi:RNA polymerase sigma-54 factor
MLWKSKRANNMKTKIQTANKLLAKPITVLVFSNKMKQAFSILQSPLLELKNYITKQIDANPLFERLPSKNDHQMDFESYIKNIPHKDSLYEDLSKQIQQNFHDKKEISLAKTIIGNLDDKGFYNPISQKEIEVTEKIKQLEPNGIGCENVQDFLLFQLKQKNKTTSLAYLLINNHFNDLLKNNINKIGKTLKISPKIIFQTIDTDIKTLSLSPISNYIENNNYSIIPDVIISYKNGKWIVDINEDDIPEFTLNKNYLKLASKENPSTTTFIEKCYRDGKWLMKNILMRRRTLQMICIYLIQKQYQFLKGKKSLFPITYKEAAKELNFHVSTILRAVSNKYVQTPRGIFSLTYFFSKNIKTTSGNILVNKSQKELLKKLVDQEDKNTPLTDEDISKKMQILGFKFARRTISKYRRELRIGSAKQRKVY